MTVHGTVHDAELTAPSSSRRALIRAGAVGGLAVLLVTACSPEKEPAAGGKTTDAAPEKTSGASDGGGAVVDDGATKAGVDPSALGKPAKTVETAAIVEGDPEASMTISVYPLQRDGRAVTATYSFVVHSSAPDPQPANLYTYFGDVGWYPFAIDATNMNRHGVIRVTGDPAVTDSQGATFLPGQTFYGYATFAAPPADVTTMNVYMAENAPLAAGVPIS